MYVLKHKDEEEYLKKYDSFRYIVVGNLERATIYSSVTRSMQSLRSMKHMLKAGGYDINKFIPTEIEIKLKQ